jgi:MOSC domain-containing protein YiiM
MTFLGSGMGELAGIARREKKRAPMEELSCANIRIESGVAHDSRGRPGQRQVTVLSAAAWRDACNVLGAEIPWTTRRANLLVEEIHLTNTVGAILHIGSVRLLVTGEVDPCSRMDEQYPGLTDALRPDWRGGVSCTVLTGGTIAIGDSIILQPAER